MPFANANEEKNKDQINVNQTLMRKEVLGATLPTLFFGGAYRKGGDDPNPGGDPETGPAPGVCPCLNKAIKVFFVVCPSFPK
ncbi:polyphenol oxidase [Corchorus olitorius]|uniref:Polyphenol oxidase n=1 Tax=Corchorus olitorius TaxID=93759 RepID=A0A1R3H4J6_9ROSI|nr:polyphenol oxidase [Corchorus olitorius]